MTVRITPAEYKKMVGNGSIAPLGFLQSLMMRDKIPTRIGKRAVELPPEQKLCVEIADFMREATLDGRIKCVWCHVVNEGKRGWLTGNILKAMGLITGAWDYCLFNYGWIEIKCGNNTLSTAQKHFGEWCDSNNVPRAVVRSLDEFKATLVKWGAIS